MLISREEVVVGKDQAVDEAIAVLDHAGIPAGKAGMAGSPEDDIAAIAKALVAGSHAHPFPTPNT